MHCINSCVTMKPQVGVCTADGSSGLTGLERVRRFFADPSAHCVGYGDRLPNNATAATAAATTSAAGVATATEREHDARDGNADGIVARHPDIALAAAEASRSKVAAGAEPPLSGKTELSPPTCPALLVSERETERKGERRINILRGADERQNKKVVSTVRIIRGEGVDKETHPASPYSSENVFTDLP